jgi:hypothetical protein
MNNMAGTFCKSTAWPCTMHQVVLAEREPHHCNVQDGENACSIAVVRAAVGTSRVLRLSALMFKTSIDSRTEASLICSAPYIYALMQYQA